MSGASTAAAPDVSVEALVGVMADLWASVDPDPEQAVRPEAAGLPRGTGPVVRGSVEISGDWNGDVVVALDEQAARRWARAMLALDEADGVSDTDVEDVVAEMANVLGGAVKACCSAGGRLGLPVVAVDGRWDGGSAGADGAAEVATGLAWPDGGDGLFAVAVVSR